MTHPDHAILKQFRGPGKCEFSGVVCRIRHAAHVVACGRGNANRLDLRCNLVSLSPMTHWASHHGHEPTQAKLFDIVAKRDGWRDGAQVEAQVRRLLRAPPQKDGAKVCPTCEGRGWAMRFPTGLYSGCFTCDGSGVLVHGEAWKEQPRTLAGS